MQLERHTARCIAAHCTPQHFLYCTVCVLTGIRWGPHPTSADAFAMESASALALAAALAVASASASALALASALTLTSASALACGWGEGVQGERKFSCHITHQSMGCHDFPQVSLSLCLSLQQLDVHWMAEFIRTEIQQLSCDGCMSHAVGSQLRATGRCQMQGWMARWPTIPVVQLPAKGYIKIENHCVRFSPAGCNDAAIGPRALQTT